MLLANPEEPDDEKEGDSPNVAHLLRAIRWSRSLGLLSVTIGLMVIIVPEVQHWTWRYRLGVWGLGIWLIPGIAYLTASGFLALRKRPPLAVVLAAALFQCITTALTLMANLLISPITWRIVVMCAVWLAVLIHFFVLAKRSFPLFRDEMDESTAWQEPPR